MELVRRARHIPAPSLNFLSPLNNPVASLIYEFLVISTVLFCIWRVLVTGWWYYANELIFVARGFGSSDVAKCIDVLSENVDPVQWRIERAIDWYWRMQCKGNRDGIAGGGWLGLFVSLSDS